MKRIAIGETSSRRGHYAVSYAEAITVLFATEGKGMDTLGRFKELLVTKGASSDQIKEVCRDMSPAFIRGIEDYFPQAEITFDKFHVMKLVNEAVDDVRIAEHNNTCRLVTPPHRKKERSSALLDGFFFL